MTDIGFGIADRRSVIVILVTMLLAEALLNLTIPIDTSDVKQLFIDIALLTGYFYAIRTLFRLPLVLIAALLVPLAKRSGSDAILGRSVEFLIGTPYYRHAELSDLVLGGRIWKGAFGTADRAALAGFTLLSAMPSLHAPIQIIGVIGLIIIVLVYVFTGTFSFLLEDALKKAEEDQERLIAAAGSGANVSFPRVIETKPYLGDPG